MSKTKLFTPVTPSTLTAGQHIVVRMNAEGCTYHYCGILEPDMYRTAVAAISLKAYFARQRMGQPGNETPPARYYWMQVRTVTEQHITLRMLIGTKTTDFTRTVVLTHIHDHWRMTASPE